MSVNKCLAYATAFNVKTLHKMLQSNYKQKCITLFNLRFCKNTIILN